MGFLNRLFGPKQQMKWFDGFWFASGTQTLAESEFAKFCQVIEDARADKAVAGWAHGYEVAIWAKHNLPRGRCLVQPQ